MNYQNIVGLIIGTRPDCMSNELLDELEKISHSYFLLIEYGIESTHNASLQFINRGHTYEEVVETIYRTHQHNILCVVHLILGLLGESKEIVLSPY